LRLLRRCRDLVFCLLTCADCSSGKSLGRFRQLKRRVDVAGSDPQHKVPPLAFVEVMPPQAVGSSECLIELEGPRGKMRIQWKGATAPDLAGLSRALWESA
jgi:hypothetical protein